MSASFLAAAAHRSTPQARFFVEIDLEAMREVETSRSGVTWRVSSPCANGACPVNSARYHPLHPELFEARTSFPRQWLAPSFAAALAEASDRALTDLVRAEVPDAVHSLDLFTPTFCTMLLDEFTHYEASGLPARRPNSMNSYGLVVNDIGLRPLLDELVKALLPLTSVLFPVEGSHFDAHHSFMVRYKRGEDTSLDMHHDDSEVTLNICLGKAFTGATLSFCGAYGADVHRRHVCTYSHERGRAVVHRGAHRHGADELESGERVSLIIWATCSTYRRTPSYRNSAIGLRRLVQAGQAPVQAGQAGASHVEVDADQPADPVCLSVRHDPDYGEHAAFPDGRTYQSHEREQHVASFSAPQALSRANVLKTLATADVAAGRWAMAASKFAAAGDYVARFEAMRTDAETDVAPGEASSRATLSLGALSLNEAQCHLRLGAPRLAILCCSRALGTVPPAVLSTSQRAKAHYRRALAQIELAEYEAAQKDLLAAAKLEPTDRLVRSKLTECKALVASARECERALYQRAFSDGSQTTASLLPREKATCAGATREDKSEGKETEEVEAELVPMFCIEALEEID